MHALSPRSTAASPEALRARRALQRLSLREDALDGKLSALESKASKLRKSSRRIQNDIFTCRAIIAPVRLLPAEVLGHIFGFLVEYPRTIFVASRVCHAWRAASMVSHLWSHIHVNSETLGAEQVARLFVERSQKAPLTVTFFQSAPSNCIWPAWGEVKRSALRWTSVNMHFDDCSTASDELDFLPASSTLREITIAIRGMCPNSHVPGLEGRLGFEARRNGVVPTRDTLAGSPHVRALHLTVFAAPCLGPLFLNLVTLSITDTSCPVSDGFPITPNELTHVLAYCRNLQHFAYDGAMSRGSKCQTQFRTRALQEDLCTHTKLKTLALKCSYDHGARIFTLLATPNLQSATLNFWPTERGLKYNSLERWTLDFLGHCPDLRTLHTHGIRGRSIVFVLTHGLANVESIHFEHAGQVDLLTDALSRRDCFSHFDEPTWLAPNLTNLVIDDDPSQVNMDNMRSLVAIRYDNRSKSDVPRPLSSCVVNGCDILEERLRSSGDVSFRARVRNNLLMTGFLRV